MKIRIEENSVRYRLRKSEVEKLARDGVLECETHFPGGILQYALTLDPLAKGVLADYSNGRISITLPESWGLDWPSSPEVGFQGNSPLKDGTELHLLVEKDFICLDRDPATQEDQYPHPKGEGGEAAC